MPDNKRLIKEFSLLVSPTLAKKFGLNEAIIIQQVHYWLYISKHKIDGIKWIYNSYTDWHKQFSWWSLRTIKRLFSKLLKDEILIQSNYNKHKSDRTSWYTLNYSKIEAIVTDCHHHSDRLSPSIVTECHYGSDKVALSIVTECHYGLPYTNHVTTTENKNNEKDELNHDGSLVNSSNNTNNDKSGNDVKIESTCLTFEKFYEMYDWNQGIADARKAFAKTTETERELIKAHVPLYVESTPNKQYRLYPAKYIRRQCWLHSIKQPNQNSFKPSNPNDDDDDYGWKLLNEAPDARH